MNKRPQVDCPTCYKKADAAHPSEYWPFCSERCKLIDLGQWADESYRVPDDEVHPNVDLPADE